MLKPLCQDCQCLDFEQLFANTQVPTMGLEIIDVGKRFASERKNDCNLCRFFRQLGPSYPRNLTLHVRLLACLEQNYDYDSSRRTYSEVISDIPQQPFFCVLRKNARLSYDYTIEGEVKGAGVTCYASAESPTAFQLCPVDAASANWKAITRQLESCSQQHPICRREATVSSRLPYLSLIDCETGSIVKGSLSDQFLALSYVWGPQNKTFNSADYFSLQNAPLTIRDAARAVLELGRRFLWVDRYCINQHDESEKKMMIENMDLIYESADATLVALDGGHDKNGLPGVSTLSRDKQPIFDTDTGHIIHSFPAIESLIETSKWNTRGWTYQEARLSRRCLFFSRHQVYMVCQHSTWSEAVPFDPNTNWITKLLNSQKLDSTLFGINSLSKDYWRDRLEYSRRNLTCEADALNAFRGVLRRSSFVTLWGVPIIPATSDIDPNVGFALGLLWIKRSTWDSKSRHVQSRKRHHSRRRSGFPTWSWTSLHADICQDTYRYQSKYDQYIDGTSVCLPENKANVQFWCLVDGYPLSLRDAIARTGSPILPEYSRELYVEGEFVRLRRNSSGAYNLFGKWKDFEQDLCPEKSVVQSASTEDDADGEVEVEALVLINWADAQRRTGTERFVLMLVNWIDEIHAERMGLLTNYRHEFRSDRILELPRIRKRFVLQ